MNPRHIFEAISCACIAAIGFKIVRQRIDRYIEDNTHPDYKGSLWEAEHYGRVEEREIENVRTK